MERVALVAAGQMGGNGRTEEVLEEKEDQEDDIWVADLLGEVAILMTDRGVVL